MKASTDALVGRVNAEFLKYPAGGEWTSREAARAVWERQGGALTFAIGSNINLEDWNLAIASLLARRKAGAISSSLLEKMTDETLPYFQASLHFSGAASLPDYCLTFSGMSEVRGFWGVGDVKRASGAMLYGGLMKIVPQGSLSVGDIVDVLRFKEGFPYQYQEVIVNLRRLADGREATAFMYTFNPGYWLSRPRSDWFPLVPFPPSNEYINLILSAARVHLQVPLWEHTLELMTVRSESTRAKLDELFAALGKRYMAAMDPMEELPLLESYRCPGKWGNWFCIESDQFISRATAEGSREPTLEEWRAYALMAVQERYGQQLLACMQLERPVEANNAEDEFLWQIASVISSWSSDIQALAVAFGKEERENLGEQPEVSCCT